MVRSRSMWQVLANANEGGEELEAANALETHGSIGDQDQDTDDGDSDAPQGETGAERLKRSLQSDHRVDKGLRSYMRAAGQVQGMGSKLLIRVALEEEWQVG